MNKNDDFLTVEQFLTACDMTEDIQLANLSKVSRSVISYRKIEGWKLRRDTLRGKKIITWKTNHGKGHIDKVFL